MTERDAPTPLRRSIRLIPLALYGVGVTVGAGIYVLTGAVAGTAGAAAPLSFLLAALLIAPTAFSFGELSSRMPFAAGEAAYVLAGFRLSWLSLLVGLMVVAGGIVSSATVTNGAAGYIGEMVPLPPFVIKIGFVTLLMGIAMWGVVQTVAVAILFTLVETGGLLLIIAAGLASPGEGATLREMFLPFLVADGLPFFGLAGVTAGVMLAFFSFIGFEDMVNMAEETEAPERTMPRAIILTLCITTLLYIATAAVALHTVAAADLAASSAPLALVFERATGHDAAFFAGIAVIATVNTVLIQMVMASRVIYGLAGKGAVPALLGMVHPATQTPLIATALVAGIIVALALFFPLEGLARTTSYIVLAVFALVNGSLVALKLKGAGPAAFTVPLAVPLLGALLSAAVLAVELWRVL
ncbi:amino acid permease [Parvibaculum sp.]|uniref:APC family permease n=1 Tax=Parvibaculum sp. TaxID=2024848 RepID=UPI000C93FCE3|nr:amino acid permease [Parvibaculum sp.]MAB13856.1 amino acid permease [Parvibaculum sp.]